MRLSKLLPVVIWEHHLGKDLTLARRQLRRALAASSVALDEPPAAKKNDVCIADEETVAKGMDLVDEAIGETEKELGY